MTATAAVELNTIPAESRDERLSHIQLLEAESIHIFREVASEFQNPVMLYSIGKDSSVMLRLAQKAFYPAPIPFPLSPRRHRCESSARNARIPRSLHRRTRLKLIVWRNEEALADGANPIKSCRTQAAADTSRSSAPRRSAPTASMQRLVARVAMKKNPAPKSASSPSVTPPASRHPKNQRPELWSLFNGRIDPAKAFASSRSPTGPN